MFVETNGVNEEKSNCRGSIVVDCGVYHMIEMMGPLLMTKMMPLWYMLMMLL